MTDLDTRIGELARRDLDLAVAILSECIRIPADHVDVPVAEGGDPLCGLSNHEGPRLEYLRCSRGADPGPDQSGEGFYEVNLHVGGMVFGETFQYYAPKPSADLLRRYHEEMGVPLANIVTGGTCTYRNGDIVLALFQEYLRTGDRLVHDFARIHGQVFADVSVSHAPVGITRFGRKPRPSAAAAPEKEAGHRHRAAEIPGPGTGA